MVYFKRLMNTIKQHEGFSTKPYKCTAGDLTIGYGRNISVNGITRKEADILLNNDIRNAIYDARIFINKLDELSDNRKITLIDMAFNLGYTKLSKFKKFKAAILNKDFEEAAKEMLDSKWAMQVGIRANRLAKFMEDG